MAQLTVNHFFTNPVADGTVTSIARPSDWNSVHAISANLLDRVGVSSGGNTAGNTGLTYGSVVFQGGNSITLSQSTAAGSLATIVVSAGNYLTTAMASNRGSDFVQANAVFNGTNASGTIASNAISVSVAAPVVVSNAIQSVGSATNSGTNASRFAADDHVHAGVFSMGASNLGNTVGDTRVDVGRFVLQGGNNVTLSQITAANALNTIIISGANAGGGDAIRGIAANGSTASTNTVNFSDANGISFGFGAAGNSTVLTASHNALTSQSNQNVTAANGGFAFQTLSFSNANAFSFGTSAGSAITGSYTVPTVTNSSWTVSDAAISITVARLAFSQSNGLTLSLSTTTGGSATVVGSYTRPVVSNAIQSVASATNSGTNTSRFAADDHVHAGVFSMGVSTGGNTSGDTRVDVGRFVLAGGNNITLSQATAANGLNTITISAGAGGAGMSAGLSNIGNTSGDTGAVTGRLIFAGGNNITLSGSTNGGSMTVTISAPNLGAGAMSAGVSTGGNTAGSTGITGTQLVLVGSGVMSLSQSTGANGGTVSILAPATSSLVGTSGISISTNGSTISVYPQPLSAWNNYGDIASGATAQGNSLVSIQPFILQWPVAFSNIIIYGSYNVATAGNNSSAFQDETVQAVIYTRNVSTLSSIFSTSQSLTRTWSSNASQTVTGVAGLTMTHAGTTLTPGSYWVAFHLSTTNTATGGAATTALTHAITMALGQSIASAVQNAKRWGGQTANSQGLIPGLGVISTGATRASIAFSDYTMTGTRAFLAPIAFELRNQTFQ